MNTSAPTPGRADEAPRLTSRTSCEHLRQPTLCERLTRSGPREDDCFDAQQFRGPETIEQVRIERALARHNHSFAPQPAKAGGLRHIALSHDASVPVVSQAGTTTPCEVIYDLNGQLALHAACPSTGQRMHNLASEHFNDSLTLLQRYRIRRWHEAIETRYSYSTLAVPLALCRVIRMRSEAECGFSFKDALEHFSVDGPSLLQTYRQGTCISFAEQLCRRIIRRLGLRAYVVAVEATRNVLTLWPSPTSQAERANPHALSTLENNTHTNVVVPYLLGGKRKFLHIVMAAGVHADSFVDYTEDQYARLPDETIIEHPARLAAFSGRCVPLLQLRNPKGTNLFEADLLRGTLRLVQAHKHRSRKLSQINLATGPAHQRESLITAATRLFDLTSDTVLDLRYLIDHRTQLLEQVLIAPGATLAACMDLRDQAVRVIAEQNLRRFKQPSSDPASHDSRNLASTLTQIDFAVKEKDTASARALYQRVIEEVIGHRPLP